MFHAAWLRETPCVAEEQLPHLVLSYGYGISIAIRDSGSTVRFSGHSVSFVNIFLLHLEI